MSGIVREGYKIADAMGDGIRSMRPVETREVCEEPANPFAPRALLRALLFLLVGLALLRFVPPAGGVSWQ